MSDAPSAARTPAWTVTLNGAAVPGVIDAQVTQSAHNVADRFSLTLARDVAGDWLAEDAILVSLTVTVSGAATELTQGRVDTVTVDAVGGTVRLEGRGLAAALLETRTQETFSNRTSSEIAKILAGRHGLRADVTPTATPVGRYYQAQHDRITLDQFSRATTEWDLLLFLAEREGFEVSVRGTVLRFGPPLAASAPLRIARPQTMAMRLERTLTLARDIEVTVKSWNTFQNKAFTETARGTSGGRDGAGREGGGRDGGGGTTQRYVIVRPNLTPAEALNLAQAQLAAISRHERRVVVTMPGDPAFAARTPVTVTGTGTGFDAAYAVDTVTFALSATRGFSMVLRLMTPIAAQATTPASPAFP